MSGRIIYDGLDIRKEYKRICELPCWHKSIHDKAPKLDIVIVRKGNVRTLSTARWQIHHIRLRIRVRAAHSLPHHGDARS